MSYIMTQTCQSPFLGLVHSSLTILMTTLINSQELPRTDPVLFYCNKAARMALQCFTDQRPADSSVCGWCSRLALSYMCGQHGEPCSQAGISEAVPIFNAVLPEASSLHTKIEPSNDLIDYRCWFKFHILCWGKFEIAPQFVPLSVSYE